jgi:cysteinyl-tRNA synthetase
MKREMNKLFLFNTLTKRKELFSPLFPPRSRIYSCGPTVYGHTHLGHMRTYTNTDFLLRALKYLGYQPYQVMNITDVGHLVGDQDSGEDKLEKAAKKENLTAWDLSKKYTDEFFQVLAKLNIAKARATPKATENINEMILLVEELERRGFAYKISDGVYFDTSKLADYGRLANVSLKDLEEGARVEKNPEKKNPTDFALWKFSSSKDKRQMEWPSPWSKRGFPGWHIECSVMAMKYLSDCFKGGQFNPGQFQTIDIHTGGIEHINIHHTNEIAQTKAATGKKLALFWVHFNWLQVEGRKMSKSLGNFYTQKDLIDRGYKDFMPLRYLFLNTHYRKVMNFTWSALRQAQGAYQEIIDSLGRVLDKEILTKKLDQKNLGQREEKYFADFDKAIKDDLNMPRALAVFHAVVKDKKMSADKRWQVLGRFDQVLGLGLKEKIISGQSDDSQEAPSEVLSLVRKRQKAREEKDWSRADKIRAQIEKKGFLIDDTPEGPKLTSK